MTATGSVADPGGANNRATDDDTVIMRAVLGFAKTFVDGTIAQGAETELVFTIDKTGNGFDATSMTFSDPFPAGLVVTDPAGVTNGCGGTFTANPGEATVGLVNGTVGTGLTCEIRVTIRALGVGSLTSNPPETAQGADTRVVTQASAPAFAKVFAPDTIVQGVNTTLTFTIDNSVNAVEATDVVFTDPFPSGLVAASPTGVANGCGSTFSATPRAGSVALSGVTLAAGARRSIAVNVQALLAGTLNNTTSTLTSSLADAAPATASLGVNVNPLDLAISFAPSKVVQFQTLTVTYTFTNAAAIGATSITLTDMLPAGVTVASPEVKSKTCSGGMVSALAGGGTIDYAGGELAAGASCSISVDVVLGVIGSYNNANESATSSLGTSAIPSATPTVDPATTGTVTFVQNTDTDGDHVFSWMEALLNFTITATDGSGPAEPITLTSGTYLVMQNPSGGVGNISISCDDGISTGDPVSRTITLNLQPLEMVTCTITLIETRQKTVGTINRFLTKRADLILSSDPNSSRRFDQHSRGFGNASLLSFSSGDLKSFLPFSADIGGLGGRAREFRFSSSLVQMRQAAASLQLAHGGPEQGLYVDDTRADVWFEAQYKAFDSSDSRGHCAIAYVGVDHQPDDPGDLGLARTGAGGRRFLH